jgi:hypothetical protein
MIDWDYFAVMLTSVLGKRVEVQPAVAVGAGVASRCNALAEVVDNLLGHQ